MRERGWGWAGEAGRRSEWKKTSSVRAAKIGNTFFYDPEVLESGFFEKFGIFGRKIGRRLNFFLGIEDEWGFKV